MNAAKNVMSSNYKNMELDEYLKESLRETGYGGVDIQKTPIGTRITLYVTRPGLVIGRKGSGIKDLTSKLEQKFGLNNPQISVMEIEVPELNPQIMANRIAQLVERGTAFRRASMWTMNTVMGAGAMGVEISIAGKLRSERAHFEKHSSGVVPKSGNAAGKIVKLGITDVLTKMGLMGIQLRIALKNEIPPDFELIESKQEPVPDNNLQSESDIETEPNKSTVQENTNKKKSQERNSQHLTREQQKQPPKSKDLRDKPMNQDKLKEKRSVPTNTK
ncbi:MAG TPA: 30S ribosomal protein S3 [Nitrososphaeraceae archaeon]|jgi:small subunit ribosomal protein S3|nr:30S ribosomal protein S3 [Nitrososphaeraceae archaeon]